MDQGICETENLSGSGRAMIGCKFSLRHQGVRYAAALAGGRPGHMSKHTPWDKDAAARVQSAAAKNPDSASARDGLDREAQSQADKNEGQEEKGQGGDAA